MIDITNQFFEPIKEIKDCKELNYGLVNHYIEPLIALSKTSNQSIYIIDYYKKEFTYVSSNPLFLCGYSHTEVKQMGYNYFERVVIPEDLEMLLTINKKGFEFFYNLPVNKRNQCFISYDFRIKHQNGSSFMIKHKLVPLRVLNSGNMWLALCIVNLSESKYPGNAYIQMLNEPVQFTLKKGKFVLKETSPLSQRETQVLRLCSHGYTSSEISSALNIDFNTVKFHKKNILIKLEVKNTTEAINSATLNNLI